MIGVPEAHGTVELSGKLRPRALWKLLQAWKHRTLPHLLGTTERFHKLPQGPSLLMRIEDKNRKRSPVHETGAASDPDLL